MIALRKLVVFCLIVLSCHSASATFQSSRLSRFLSFFTIIKFDNAPCHSLQNQTGTCVTSQECQQNGGMASGSCAQNYGVCCVYNLTCGSTTSQNVSYFSNPGFPHPLTNGNNSCSLTINKTDESICQIRLDFLDFNVGGPFRSACRDDQFKIPGSHNGPICGMNSGQHLYLHFDVNSSSISMEMLLGDKEMNRTWNIKVSQIACNSPLRAPAGCLQYFTDPEGEVKSFNYDSESENDTNHLANQKYTICIKNEPDSCAIKWSAQDASKGFDIAGSLGTSTTRPAEDQCYLDYIIIPGHSSDGNEPTADRQCGQRISATDNVGENSHVISKVLPFMLVFYTDDTEISGEVNAGFSLMYEQVKTCE